MPNVNINIDELELDDIDSDIEGIGITENSIEIKEEKLDLNNDIYNSKIPLENSIEKQLKEVVPLGNETNIADVLLEKEKLKNEIIDKFLSTNGQKTEVTPSERKVIPLLRQLALNPFPDIACHISDTRKKEQILKEFETPILEEWITEYINLGIPVNRKGRKEEVDVLKSYLDDDLNVKENGKGSFQ